jgi:hypothetical protein
MRERFENAVAILVLAAILALGLAAREDRKAQAASGDPANLNGMQAPVYPPDCAGTTAAVAARRTGIAVPDSFTTTYILALPKVILGDCNHAVRQTVNLSLRFSASGANVPVRLAYVSEDSAGTQTIKGYSGIVTITAGSSLHEGTYYPAPDFPFDTEGSTSARVLVTAAPSSGTVDIWPGSN